MKGPGKHILLFALLLAGVQALQAQSIPKMKRASEISVGSFPNGVEYYMVNNKASAGRADFALIQNGEFDVDESRDALRDLEHIDPESFLRRNGVPYSEDGFITYYEGARVYRFQGIDVSTSEVCDSTLLLMLDLMSQSPYTQTVVVCGDINKDVLVNRFQTLSLLVPQVKDFEFESSIPKEGSLVRNDSQPGRMSLHFQQGSVSREEAGTPVPLVSESLTLQLMEIIKDRLALSFRKADIPHYVKSTQSSLEIMFDEQADSTARSILRCILSDLARGGATVEELVNAKKLSLPTIVATGLKNGKSNSYYVDRCISAVLTGSNLASEESIKNFFLRRKISDARELELFNNYVAALLGDEFDSDSNYSDKRTSFPDMDNVLKHTGRGGAKLVNFTAEPLTGGSYWIFSNGIKVIYKNLPNVEGFNFCLAQRGGASSMSDLHQGESPFLSDMLALCRIAGVEGREFQQMLRANGIEIYNKVTLEDIIIGGHAPSAEIENVLKILVKIAYDRQPDLDAFTYYRKCEQLRSRRDLPSTYAVVDSLMCREYPYHSNSSAYNIQNDLIIRVDHFFEERFANVKDGVFIFIGNLPEAELQQALGKYLGLFRTHGPYAFRPRVRYDIYSGRSTYIVEGQDESINLAVTGLMRVNIENYLTYLLAQEAISCQFAKSLAPLGLYAEVSGIFDISPVDRFSFYVTLRPCQADGLPPDVRSLSPMEAISQVREEFDRMQYIVISDEEFQSYKRIVENKIADKLATSQGMMEYALFRYSNGRDLTSSYKDVLKKIVIDDVRWMLEEVISSGVVEYIIK